MCLEFSMILMVYFTNNCSDGDNGSSVIFLSLFKANSFHSTSVKKEPSTVRGRRSFVCAKCDKQFTAKGTLQTHVQVHSGKFTYYCEICRKGFTSNTNLKMHMRSHEGLKYYCSYCGKAFVNKQTLDYHLSIHTGQYRFTCERCGKGFNNKRFYEKHDKCLKQIKLYIEKVKCF